MPVTPDEEFAFEAADADPLVAVIDDLTEAGGGWVNLVPEVEPGVEVSPRSFLAVIFSARGEPVPLATWTAPTGPRAWATVGIEHGTGPKALERLSDAGVPLPPRWRKLNDHARRGLVVTVPPATAAADVIEWLLAAADVLSIPPLTGAWLARVHRPRG